MAVRARGGVGISAARRLAELGRTTIRPGLTAREFDRIEQRFGFEFADDHRAFLAHGLPVWTEGDDDPHKTTDMAWPDWRDGDPGRLREQLDFAMEGALHRIKDGYWHPWWGDQRPTQPSEALRIARDRLVADGRWCRYTCTASYRPGGTARATQFCRPGGSTSSTAG
jgi:hypothetical protein